MSPNFSFKKYFCELGICVGTGYLIGWGFGLFLVWLGNILLTVVGITATKIIISTLFVVFIAGIFISALVGFDKMKIQYKKLTGQETMHPIFDMIVLGYRKISDRIKGFAQVTIIPKTQEVRL